MTMTAIERAEQRSPKPVPIPVNVFEELGGNVEIVVSLDREADQTHKTRMRGALYSVFEHGGWATEFEGKPATPASDARVTVYVPDDQLPQLHGEGISFTKKDLANEWISNDRLVVKYTLGSMDADKAFAILLYPANGPEFKSLTVRA